MAKKKKLRIVDLDKLSAGMRVTANAIRAKGNTTGAIEWDYTNGTGFANAVRNIPLDGGVPILTDSEWKELTTEQKQAYGYVGIVISSGGFTRGKLVYGGDYVPLGQYLPYSNITDVICEAYGDNYRHGESVWGAGDYPIQFMKNLKQSYVPAEEAVLIPTYTSGTIAYIDLMAMNTPFTAYIVGKIGTNNGGNSRLLCCLSDRYSDRGIMLEGNDTVRITQWLTPTNTTISAKLYFAAAIQFSNVGSTPALGVVRDKSYSTGAVWKSPKSSGRYVTIGRSDINDSEVNAEPSDMYVRYMAVVRKAESQDTVLSNLEYLASAFL